MEFVFLLLTALCFFFFFSITNYHFCGILASSHQLYNLLNEYNHSEEKMASFVEVVLKCCSISHYGNNSHGSGGVNHRI